MYDKKLLQTIIIDIVVVSNFEGAIAIRKYSPYRKVYIVPEGLSRSSAIKPLQKTVRAIRAMQNSAV